MDITQLITDSYQQRRLFALIDELARPIPLR